METIEERAMMLAEFVLHEVQKATYNECVKIVTEIDRIARQEERERCIKAAQDAHCALCNYNDGICDVCTSFYECDERDMIRIEMKKKLLKMEGGENG